MTLDDQDIRALTFLACRSRPTGARQWTEADVYAEIAKLRTRPLPSVVCAVTRAAMDRGCERPSVIGSAGSHWSDTVVPGAFVPNIVAPEERCSICSRTEENCRRTQGVDMRLSIDPHEFESAAMAARRRDESDPAAVQGAIAALKAEIAATEREPAPTGLDASTKPELKARLDALLANNPGLKGPPMTEPTPEPPAEPTATGEAPTEETA